MDCTLATLIACFTWSGFYVDGGLSYQDVGIPRDEIVTQVSDSNGVTQTLITTETISDAMNPYGWLAFGYELDLGSVRWTFEARHAASSLQTSRDAGINSLSLGLRWYPFRR